MRYESANIAPAMQALPSSPAARRIRVWLPRARLPGCPAARPNDDADHMRRQPDDVCRDARPPALAKGGRVKSVQGNGRALVCRSRPLSVARVSRPNLVRGKMKKAARANDASGLAAKSPNTRPRESFAAVVSLALPDYRPSPVSTPTPRPPGGACDPPDIEPV